MAKIKTSFCLEKVAVLVFGEAGGVPFPRFGLRLPADKTAKDFILDVEMKAQEILWEISDKEYLARRKEAGNMPRTPITRPCKGS